MNININELATLLLKSQVTPKPNKSITTPRLINGITVQISKVCVNPLHTCMYINMHANSMLR